MLKGENTMLAYFNRFEIELTKKQALQGSHIGSCDNDIKELIQDKKIKKQLDKINPEDLKEELSEYGAWDSEQLSNYDDNLERILWIACGNIRDELAEKGKI